MIKIPRNQKLRKIVNDAGNKNMAENFVPLKMQNGKIVRKLCIMQEFAFKKKGKLLVILMVQAMEKVILFLGNINEANAPLYGINAERKVPVRYKDKVIGFKSDCGANHAVIPVTVKTLFSQMKPSGVAS